MEAADTPEHPAADETDGRATLRESLFLGVDITCPGVKLSGRIRNVSATGALVEADARFEVGDHLVLTFRGVTEVGGTVVRKTLKGVGVRFDAKIDPTSCKQSLKGSGNNVSNWPPPSPPTRYGYPGLPVRPRRQIS